MKKILAILMSAVLAIAMAMPIMGAGGDNTGDDIFGMNMYVIISETEGEYTIGDTFSFKVTAYVGDLYEKTAVRNVSITGPEEVSNFQFKNDSGEWKDIDEFNVEEIIKNEVNREIQVEFNAVGTYAINFKYTDGSDKVYGSAETKYITITETSYSVSTDKPAEPTTPEITTTPEVTTPEVTTPEVTTPEVTTPEVTTPEVTTPEVTTPEVTTPEVTTPEVTTVPDATTTGDVAETTTVEPKTTVADKVSSPAKTKVNQATKKVAKKIKLSLKKIKDADGYKVAVYKTKKNANKNKKAIVRKIVKKAKVTITSKKLKNKKKLYVRARAYVLDAKGNKVYGKWSKAKKVKIKK